MNRILLILSSLMLCTVDADEIYRSEDSNGTNFSDRPSPNAEPVELGDIQTVSPPPSRPLRPLPKEAKPVSYETLKVLSPAEGTVLNDNTGNVAISVQLQPALQTGLGHEIVLRMNGQEVARGIERQLNLSNVYRGTYSLIAVVVDRHGKQIKTSAPISFTVSRHFNRR